MRGVLADFVDVESVIRYLQEPKDTVLAIEPLLVLAPKSKLSSKSRHQKCAELDVRPIDNNSAGADKCTAAIHLLMGSPRRMAHRAGLGTGTILGLAY